MSILTVVHNGPEVCSGVSDTVWLGILNTCIHKKNKCYLYIETKKQMIPTHRDKIIVPPVEYVCCTRTTYIHSIAIEHACHICHLPQQSTQVAVYPDVGKRKEK